MAKGDILILCPDSEYWPNIRVILREGSPSTTRTFNGIDFEESAGDGEMLGHFRIYREYHIPNG